MRLSAYPNIYARDPAVLSLESMDRLAEELWGSRAPAPSQGKDHAPLISSPADWVTPKRAKANVRTLGRLFIADIDRVTQADMYATIQSLQGTSAVVYTSYNHGVLKDPAKEDPAYLCRFRVLVELDREYPVEQHAAVWSACNARLGGCVDPQTKDPCRMFTVPLLRPEQPQTEFFCRYPGQPWQVDQLLQEAAYVPGQGHVEETAHAVSREDLADMFTDWIRQRKSDHLRRMGRAGRKALDGQSFAEPGDRNNTAWQLACAICDRFPRGSAADIASHLAVGVATTDGSIDFQDMIARRQGEVIDEQKAEVQRLLNERAARIRQSFGGLREHPATDEEIEALIQHFGLQATPQLLEKLFIVGKGHHYYMLRPDGSYLEPQADINLSVAAERDLAVFPQFSAWDRSYGEPRKKRQVELLEQYSDVLDLVRYDMSARRTTYDPVTRVMTVATCPPRVEPVYHAEVQQWLEILAPNYLAVDMASTMGRLDEIAPALVITGGPDTGKTFFATVASHIYSEGWTDMNEFTSSFNDVVRRCPIVVGDEKPGAEYMRNGSSFIRSHLSRKERSYDEKYQPKGKLYGAIRMIILANNLGVIATKEDLNTEDVRALLERLVHIHIGEASRQYLYGLGGARHLNQHWLREGWGPQHFLWLSENWNIQNPGNRFLVQSYSPDLYRKVFGRQGIKGEVITFLLNYLASPEMAANRQLSGIQIAGGKLYVQAKTIHTLWGTYMGSDKPPTQNRISEALAGGIAVGRYKKLQVGDKRVNFHQVDTEVLRGALDEHHMTEEMFNQALGGL